MFKKKRFKIEISMKSGNVITVKCKSYDIVTGEDTRIHGLTMKNHNFKTLYLDCSEIEAVLVTKCY
jgi:hypothetical protein